MTEHVDVVIIGAGLSGIGAACHLQRHRPGTTYVILEGRDAIGGTWDLFRYPGIRSDSDMFTLGYNFKPWTNPQSIADGPSILSYIREAAAEYRVVDHIRFNNTVRRADWSTGDAEWSLTVETERTDPGGAGTACQSTITCGFVMACTGYFNFDAGYTPPFAGTERFGGRIIHPQHWPEDLDYAGKQVVVIGSGATAVTLVPTLAQAAAHVVMLQRSPTYLLSLPEEDVISNALRRYLPDRFVYRLTRARNVIAQLTFYKYCRSRPHAARRLLLSLVRKELDGAADMAHFSPTYQPWDERLCAVRDGDLFAALRRGTASVVTDHVETFTETGLRLESGEELAADIIVTATGLDVRMLGGMEIWVDGARYDHSKQLNYKGVMFQDIPNLSMVFGYTNASWTLKADISSEYVCRVLEHMATNGWRQCTPRLTDPTVRREKFVDMTSGYLACAGDELPPQGDKAPWRVYMNYALDYLTLRYRPIDDGTLEFSNPDGGR